LETWFSPNYDIRMSSNWSIGEIKSRFEKWIKRNYVNGVSLFHLYYLISLMVYLYHNGHQMSKSSTLWLIGSSSDCAKYGLKTRISRNDEIRKCLLDMKHGSNKNAFWDVINNKWYRWFHLFFKTLMAYLRLQRHQISNPVFYVWLVDLQIICAI
jgi:hypothetical protein